MESRTNGTKKLFVTLAVFQYKSGRLFPEYRPAASPTIIPSLSRNLKFQQKQQTRLCAYIPQVKRDKLDKKAEAGIFVSYSTISKAYRVFQPHPSRVIVSQNVHFAGNEQWNWEELTKVNQISNAPNNLIFGSMLEESEDERQEESEDERQEEFENERQEESEDEQQEEFG